MTERPSGTTKHISANSDQPVLLLAQITFQTYDECKDHDTHVDTGVYDLSYAGGVPNVAHASSDYYHFDNNTINGPFPMTVSPVPKDKLSPATFTIKITPNGDDTWHVSCYLDLTFTDGSHITFDSGRMSLDEDTPTILMEFNRP